LLKKPVSIVTLSILFILSPLVILILNSAINMVPLIGSGSIIYRLKPFDLIILALYLLTGVSIFLVRKWGWWVIIISAAIMFTYNLITLYYNPFSSLLILLLMNLSLFSVTLVFFRKHLIAPYFNPQLRWWEQDQRYEIDIYLKFLGINRNVIISDISEGGCYIFVDFLIDKGSELPVLIVCGTFHITVKAIIMRIAKESDRYYGYGLMFQKVEDIEKDGLKKLITKLKAFSSYETDNIDSDEKRNNTRYFISYDLSVSAEKEESPANLHDISKSGCSIQTAIDIDAGSICIFNFRIEQINYKIMSKVVWKKGDQGDRHLGLKFINPDKKQRIAIHKMIIFAEKLGATKREISKDVYYKQCEEKLDHTPYKLVRFLKKILNIK
jgi:hypothetical protein